MAQAFRDVERVYNARAAASLSALPPRQPLADGEEVIDAAGRRERHLQRAESRAAK